jgi:hypothetical protein
MGEAMGQILRKFWDPDWFYSQLKKREKIQEDVCCLEGGVISTINEPDESTGKDAYERARAGLILMMRNRFKREARRCMHTSRH